MAKEFTISIHDPVRLQRQEALSDVVCKAAKAYGKRVGAETPVTLFALLDQAVAHSLLWEHEYVNWLADRDGLAWEVAFSFHTAELIVGTITIDDDKLAAEWVQAFPDWEKDIYAPYAQPSAP